VCPEDIELLGVLLATGRSLRQVELSLLSDGPLDIQELANGLASETCAIEKLVLIFEQDVGIQAARDMARVIRGNTSLTTLYLLGLHGVGTPVLAAAFHHNSVIEQLYVSFDSIPITETQPMLSEGCSRSTRLIKEKILNVSKSMFSPLQSSCLE